jgi:hypothetical protein
MQRFRDAEGVRWSVRRVWWAFGDIEYAPTEWGILFWISFVWTACQLIAWPIWLVVKVVGLSPWTIHVRRKGKIVQSEKVKGFGASRRRIVELADELRARPGPVTGEPESGAVELR